MTPKEKANELVQKFEQLDTFVMSTRYNRVTPIQCALLAVSEIFNLDVIWYDKGCNDLHTQEQTFEFWEQVENELNKMIV